MSTKVPRTRGTYRKRDRKKWDLVTTKQQTDLLGALFNIDGQQISKAIDRLDAKLQQGIRHFSAVGCVVPLHMAESAGKEIARLEIARASDEIASE